MDRGAWWATVRRVAKSQTHLKWLRRRVREYSVLGSSYFSLASLLLGAMFSCDTLSGESSELGLPASTPSWGVLSGSNGSGGFNEFVSQATCPLWCCCVCVFFHITLNVLFKHLACETGSPGGFVEKQIEIVSEKLIKPKREVESIWHEMEIDNMKQEKKWMKFTIKPPNQIRAWLSLNLYW